MRLYSNITVFNNEGQQLGTDRRYLAQITFRSDRVRYGCEGMANIAEATIAPDTFDDIADFLFDALNGTLQTGASTICRFSDEKTFRNWMRNLHYTERDVSWAVICKVRNSECREIYICTDGSAAPAELDELEKMIRSAFDMEGVA